MKRTSKGAGHDKCKDPVRDGLIVAAGRALGDGGKRIPPTFGVIYSGGGIHVGPHTRRKEAARPKLKFSFDQEAKGLDVCYVFHKLQDVLRGGVIDFDEDCNEDWEAQASMTCPSKKCKKRR